MPRHLRFEVRTSPKAVHGTALAYRAKWATRDRSNGNGLIDCQAVVEAQGRAGAPGIVEEPDDFAELIIVQFVGRPVLIDQLSDVAFERLDEPTIDADAWTSLHKTVSRPFDKPETGKIAVKVINDYGDEVMEVFEVS